MGSISAAFSLVSFVAGLFCVRLKTALIAGAIPAVSIMRIPVSVAVLRIAVAVAVMAITPRADVDINPAQMR
jgi:hypothetical protein